jgi:hypothetical protein
VAEREQTGDLAEGLAGVRWGDDQATLQRLYPEARERYARWKIGDTMETTRDLEIPGLLQGYEPVFLRGGVSFFPEGVRIITLSGSADTDDEGQSVVDVLPCIRDLARRFGFGPVEAQPTKQEWRVRGVQVILIRWDVDAFTLRVNRPGFISEVRADERILFPPRIDPTRPGPQPAFAHPELPARPRPDGFVVCPFCAKAFRLSDTARWKDSRHTTCGQRIRLE